MFPAWLAVMEHIPPFSSVTVVPETVQIVRLLEAKLTVSPEVDVACSASVPGSSFAGALKVMVCAFSTVNDCVTFGAAA